MFNNFWWKHFHNAINSDCVIVCIYGLKCDNQGMQSVVLTMNQHCPLSDILFGSLECLFFIYWYSMWWVTALNDTRSWFPWSLIWYLLFKRSLGPKHWFNRLIFHLEVLASNMSIGLCPDCSTFNPASQ